MEALTHTFWSLTLDITTASSMVQNHNLHRTIYWYTSAHKRTSTLIKYEITCAQQVTKPKKEAYQFCVCVCVTISMCFVAHVKWPKMRRRKEMVSDVYPEIEAHGVFCFVFLF